MIKDKIYDLPCQCGKCGNIYFSGNKMRGEAIMGEFYVLWKRFRTEAHLRYPCPNCRTDNPLNIDLIYLIEDSVRAFQSKPLDQLLDLQESLRSKLSTTFGVKEFEEAKSEIVKVAPELKSFKDLWPKTRQEAYAAIAIVVAVIFGVITAIQSGEKDTVKEFPQIEEIITTTKITILDSDNTVKYTELKGKTLKISSVGRNEPCPCGSGKKFKKCHGK